MKSKSVYKPNYENGWALVIGINDYEIASPLRYARMDAEAVARTLESSCGFAKDNITVLLDKQATGLGIRTALLEYTGDVVGLDDRIVVFFAGHGHTRSGSRGDVGYLVPVDGDTSKLQSLIRWDELTNDSDLIVAKHVLFVTDACYGGLALTRGIPSGSTRFLRDMLQRYARQVLTAGKADETVSDSGGPRPDHSVFTGHFLDALEGAGARPDGIITAQSVMAYVYDRVAKDAHSRQTPHYGFHDGSGDLIFRMPKLDALDEGDGTEEDVLMVQVPLGSGIDQDGIDKRTLVEKAKDYLSDRRYRIRLFDLVAKESSAALRKIKENLVPLSSAEAPPGAFASQVREYQDALSDLIDIAIILSRWADKSEQAPLAAIIARLGDPLQWRDAREVKPNDRWFPLLLIVYAGGTAAMSARNYASLTTLLMHKVSSSEHAWNDTEIVMPLGEFVMDIEGTQAFKKLPGHENLQTPRSEYLIKALQSRVEDLLYLGSNYEEAFDLFEVLFALVHADIRNRDQNDIWGPVGRFVYKGRRGRSNSPLQDLIDEANLRKAEWEALQYGLFAGSFERFYEIASKYRDNFLRG